MNDFRFICLCICKRIVVNNPFANTCFFSNHCHCLQTSQKASVSRCDTLTLAGVTHQHQQVTQYLSGNNDWCVKRNITGLFQEVSATTKLGCNT